VSGNSDGGIWNGANMTIKNSTVSGNSALAEGGGILSHGILSRLTLINSTVSGNSAVLDGGGIWNDSFGVILFNATITNNTSNANFGPTGTGGGIFNDDTESVVYFQNTILAGNFEGSAFGECAGTINSNGNNLMQNVPGDCAVSGQPVTFVASPGIGSLRNNGGPTQTHALLPGSPAIDAGNTSGCRDQAGALLWLDQRGFRRTAGSRCDIGAYEFGSGPIVSVLPDADFDGDGKADVGVYRDGLWLSTDALDPSGASRFAPWGGLPQDIPVPADYSGSVITDYAFYRDGIWFIRSQCCGDIVVGWGGLPQDVPMPGDYDGDGMTNLAVYREGIWYILRSSDGGVSTRIWGGSPQDVPLN
jgi:hypothetical protein